MQHDIAIVRHLCRVSRYPGPGYNSRPTHTYCHPRLQQTTHDILNNTIPHYRCKVLQDTRHI